MGHGERGQAGRFPEGSAPCPHTLPDAARVTRGLLGDLAPGETVGLGCLSPPGPEKLRVGRSCKEPQVMLKSLCNSLPDLNTCQDGELTVSNRNSPLWYHGKKSRPEGRRPGFRLMLPPTDRLENLGPVSSSVKCG